MQSLVPSQEGDIPFSVPSVNVPCFTHYKVFGDLPGGTAPVVIVHGGPGAGHEYLLSYAELWPRYGIPVVFYDQIGCASSTHLRHTAGDTELWQESLFTRELENLLDYLNLRDGSGFHLLGQSWGGMMGANFAGQRPRGLQKLVLASALASKELGRQGLQSLREQLPIDAQKAMNDADRDNDYESDAFKSAFMIFYRKHLCRADPFPPADLVPAMKNLSEDTTVYRSMQGPSPIISLKDGGSLRGWTAVPSLPNISAPTLVFNGEFDSSDNNAQVPFFELIPRVRWITFPNGGHMCHLEDGLRNRVLTLVGEFLKGSTVS